MFWKIFYEYLSQRTKVASADEGTEAKIVLVKNNKLGRCDLQNLTHRRLLGYAIVSKNVWAHRVSDIECFNIILFSLILSLNLMCSPSAYKGNMYGLRDREGNP